MVGREGETGHKTRWDFASNIVRGTPSLLGKQSEGSSRIHSLVVFAVCRLQPSRLQVAIRFKTTCLQMTLEKKN